jgi:UDP-N-acetylmuramate dehydrogenase
MLNEPWKARLIRFAHMHHGQGASTAIMTHSPKRILGRKIYKRQIMSQSTHWLTQIQGKVLQSELMSAHTSLCIGGPADLFIIPKNIQDLKTIFKKHGDLPLFILGEGTNLLVRDKGFRGIVLSIKESFKTIHSPQFRTNEQGEEIARVTVGAGTKMSYLVKYLARYSLTGIEDLVGIPGSLGGALIMNAGADGTEVGQVVHSITRVNSKGELETLTRDQLKFEYRKTTFPEPGGVIVEAQLELKKGDPLAIQAAIDSHLTRRRNKQPLTMPNTGSVFKNPPGDAAGRLIEAAGLKGYRIGGAGVSSKHANFIVNHGDATAAEVQELITHIQTVVRNLTGIDLETEVVIAGDE